MTTITSHVRARKFELSVGLSIAAHLVAVRAGSALPSRTVNVGPDNQSVCFVVPGLRPQGVVDNLSTCRSTVNAGEGSLEDLDHPTIKENHFSPADAIAYRSGLNDYLAKGKRALEQYAREGRSDLDFGEFFISFEYFAQHLEPTVYLMPKDSREELLKMYRQDVAAFAPIAQNAKLTREEKFQHLAKIVYSKSVYDPGAQILNSLLVPEGGQSCRTSTLYEFALADHYRTELLGPGERFVIGEYGREGSDGHAALGVLNANEESLYLLENNQTVKRWRAHLYDPHLYVQLDVEHYDAGSRRSYDNYLVRRANENADAPKGGKVAMMGLDSPLAFNPGAPLGIFGRDLENVTLKREPANEELKEKRLARAGRVTSLEVAILPDTTMKAIAAANELARINNLPPGKIIMKINPNTNQIELKIDSPELKDLSSLAGITEGISSLDLSETSISDLRPLAGLTELQALNLRQTPVSDLRPLAGLTKLSWLGLAYTPVNDLRPLSSLTGLQDLNLGETKISDLRPLSGLTGLQELNLGGTRVSDLRPLSSLTGLSLLFLNRTPVSDLRPLSSLTGLKGLELGGTKISDFGPLAGLTGLQVLELNHTSISDLRPLAGLTELQVIDLFHTPVSDLRPLSGLSKLRKLHIPLTSISDLRPLSGLTRLQGLDLGGAPVSDLRPLSGLIGLQELDLSETKISDLQPLSGLTGLQVLNLNRTPVSDLRPLSSLTGLEELRVFNTPVNDFSPIPKTVIIVGGPQ